MIGAPSTLRLPIFCAASPGTVTPLPHIFTGHPLVKWIPVALSQTVQKNNFAPQKRIFFGLLSRLCIRHNKQRVNHDALRPDTDKLWGSVDVDWTVDPYTRRSLTVFVLTA